MNNRVAFYTFGCRLNQSETAILERNFTASGYHIVNLQDNPDIVVVNTCTVTENGDADTHYLVKKINRLNPNARIALIGCQAQIQKEKLGKLHNVRWVIGNARKMQLADIIRGSETPEETQVIVPAISREAFTIPSAITAMNRGHTRANLKIQDGCDFFCSFCEIPFSRGRARSRVFNDIMVEARALVAVGHKEVVLTGINIGTYRYETKTILDVIDALEKIDGLLRIRISSIEPTTIPWELVERMGKGKLCRHLHIPLQSGSDEILRKMQRKYTAAEFAGFLEKTIQAIPGLCIGTDLIVGFPGESEKHFNETAAFVKNLPFAYFHVFSYSDRTRNKSRNFVDKVPLAKIHARSKALRELSAEKHRLFLSHFIGKTEYVLFEEGKGNLQAGLTDNYIRCVVSTGKSRYNSFLPVRITGIERQFATTVLEGTSR